MWLMNFPPGDASGDRDSAQGDFATDRNGKPILDRFGRPVRRRSPLPRPEQAQPRPAPPQYRRAEPLPPSSGAPAGPARYPAPDSRYEADPRYADGYGQQGGRSLEAARYEIPSRREERLARFGADRGRAGSGGWVRRRNAAQPGDRGRGGSIPGQASPTRRPRRGPRRFGILKTLGVILLALVVFIVGAAIWVDTSLHRIDALSSYDGRVGNTAGTNWLLVGSDSRAGLSEEDAARLTAGDLDESVGRTDTIMLVHIPSFGGQARIVSFPRDSWVNIPGHGEDKINQAFSIGGPALLQQTIEQATGLRIDHYAEIGFGGFAGLVDGVGGIEMCLDEPLDDPMAGIKLNAGCQELDGPTALGYVRSRYTSANGDLDRVERQRKFLAALSDKVASPGTILNPFKAFPVAGAVTDTLTVNESDHVWHLSSLGMALAGGAKQDTVPVSGFMDTFAGSAVVWDDAAAEELFRQLR